MFKQLKYLFNVIWPIKEAQAWIQVQRILEEKEEIQESKVIMKPYWSACKTANSGKQQPNHLCWVLSVDGNSAKLPQFLSILFLIRSPLPMHEKKQSCVLQNLISGRQKLALGAHQLILDLTFRLLPVFLKMFYFSQAFCSTSIHFHSI